MQKNISYIKISRIFLSGWHWILAFILAGICMAHCFLWFTPERYAVHALLKFEEKRTEISELINIRNLYDRTNKTESEKMVIQSKTVLKNAVAALQYPIAFYHKEKSRWVESYPLQPIAINILENRQTTTAHISPSFEFNRLNAQKYLLTYRLNDTNYKKQHLFGQIVHLPGLQFKINNSKTNLTILFKFNSTESLVQRLENALKIDELPNSNLLSLYVVDENPKLAADLLNAQLDAYLKFDKSRRLVSLAQTKNFIDTLLQDLASNLKTSGQAVATFKKRHQFLNVPENTVDKLSAYVSEKYRLEFENNTLSTFQANLGDYKNAQKLLQLPISRNQDNSIPKAISNINELLLKKQDALNFYTPNAPTLLRIEGQISELTSILNRNIDEQKRGNLLDIQNLKGIIAQIKNDFNQTPDAERTLINLQTHFNVNQKVHSYLAEKKLEAQISNAAAVAGAMIIDQADYPIKPIYPIKKNIYTWFILAGTAAGLLFTYLIRTLNPYICHPETVQALSQIPIIGIIGTIKSKHSVHGVIPTLDQPGSIFSESVRAVRSNLNFLPVTGRNKTICITSDSSGEGKSFVSANLAGSISLLGKKVLLIGADLRKPGLHFNLNATQNQGLSHYLCGKATTNDIIAKTASPYIDIISSGPIPPNPAELLHTDQMKLLLTELKARYDYIIIDTAPIGLVTDGIPLVQMTDITLFIIRSGVSRHEAALSPEQLKREFKLKNMVIVLNAFKNDRFYSDYNKQSANENHYYSGQHNPQELKSYFNKKKR